MGIFGENYLIQMLLHHVCFIANTSALTLLLDFSRYIQILFKFAFGSSVVSFVQVRYRNRQGGNLSLRGPCRRYGDTG